MFTLGLLVILGNISFLFGQSNEKRLLLNDQDVIHQELQTLRNRMTQLENENSLMKKQLQNTQGATAYTIWGRKSCPTVNGTSTMYSGLVAGKHYNEQGSGVNTLCLPHDPEPAPSDFPSKLHGGLYARIWGSEYQFNFRNVAINDDVPCAVCQVNQDSTCLMMPAKTKCPVGWHRQYSGVLIGAWSGEYSSEYICMDENPEFFEGTRSHDDNGRTLYPVRARCGSLPCPPYTDYQYISCVVCSL
ncbi:Hypothetical predicted protein [Mytilus galloprovincialis]|uniref:Short-chain collagen C4-like n=1 Tax=Mytilus galloprovincialis TaxID=29158 RepID=A0A8B6GP95_MYTGA|nr:Hypothetical predicted protein [Mytilus galloprovincialis]